MTYMIGLQGTSGASNGLESTFVALAYHALHVRGLGMGGTACVETVPHRRLRLGLML